MMIKLQRIIARRDGKLTVRGHVHDIANPAPHKWACSLTMYAQTKTHPIWGVGEGEAESLEIAVEAAVSKAILQIEEQLSGN